MKKGFRSLSVIFLVVLVFYLSGCSVLNSETNKISKSKELTAKDISSEYNINAESLATYNYEDDPNVSYVNINEFITFMSGGIVDLDISKGWVMKISYTFDVPSEYKQKYDESTYKYEMTIDAKKEVIYYNDFEMISNLNIQGKSKYKTDLFISDYEIDNSDRSLEIDLKPYDLDIVLCKNQYYMPLYLANLFFTGSNINVYEMNDDIYILDNLTDYNELIKKFKEDDSFEVSDISSHIENYLALYFDYFYGLKNYKNIDTYRDIIDGYEFEKQEDFNSLHKELEKFLYSNDDLHTTLISAGYMDKNYKSHVYNKRKDKISNYIHSYSKNKCKYRGTEEITYSKYKDTLVVHINAFSLETKTLLEPFAKEAEKYDNIIIDVSCNPGGIVIGVVELLSYMTNEKIPLSYINTQTGVKATEYYETSNNVYLDKNFFVYTSGATFSAANLFASIVKDQELGIILGENTSGGASPITYTVLPDGAIIVNSSNLTLLNKDDEIIEDGIKVDIDSKIPIDWYDLTTNINYLFADFSEISTNRKETSNSVTYDFEIDKNLENISIQDYKILVYDYKTNKLLNEEHFEQDDFTYTIDKLDATYRVKVYVKYSVNNISREEIIYTDIIDDHPDSFDVNATEVPLDERISAYAHIKGDKDTFKFTVSESDKYRIELNDGELSSSHRIYDENGNFVGEGYDYKLEPGVYYVVSYIYDRGDYTIKIRQLVDDNSGPTIINLQEGIQIHKIYYDYQGDEESFEITLTEESMVTFSWDTDNEYYKYSITKSNGELFAPNSDRIKAKDDITIVMPKGTYNIKLNDHHPLGELNLTTTTSTDFDDYSSDTSLESDNYGELIIGTNTMEFFTLWDEDVYYIDITEPGNYLFEYSMRNGDVYYIDSNGALKNLYSNHVLSLSQGRHYFVFKSNGEKSTIDFELIHDVDLNDENNMENIYLDQETSTIISDSTDVDYFKFHSNEMKTYRLITNGTLSGMITIVDLEGNIIARSDDDIFHFAVQKGTYILKVESRYWNYDTRKEANLLITEYTGEDDAPNLLYLPIEYYKIADMNNSNRIEGVINYDDDYDVYVINIEEDGMYKSYMYGRYLNIYCYDTNGNSYFWNYGLSIYLEAGTYYVKISSSDTNDKYTVVYAKVE